MVFFPAFSPGLLFTFFLLDVGNANHIITSSSVLTDNITLVSSNGRFELGFFCPGNSNRKYLGIWYYNISPKTVVWVANKGSPLNNSSLGLVKIAEDGNLILQDHTQQVFWSTNVTNLPSSMVTAKILDSGNLVLVKEDQGRSEDYVWQSFDYPSDTFLEGMSLGRDPKGGLDKFLRSWKSADDPSEGPFTYGVSHAGLPELIIRKYNNQTMFRSGPWNEVSFSGFVVLPNSELSLKTIINGSEISYEFGNTSVNTRSVLSYTGEVHRFLWNTSNHLWINVHTLPSSPCDEYDQCGSNSICSTNGLRICSCLPGYVPRSPQDWQLLITSGGCIREHPINCSEPQSFQKFVGVKVPDLLRFSLDRSMSLKECEVECLKNCACTAYAASNASGKGSGCLMWYDDLIDIQQFPNSGTQDLYVRIRASNKGSPKWLKPMVIATLSIALVVVLAGYWVIKKTSKLRQGAEFDVQPKSTKDLELPTFSISIIEEATAKFSDSNKIGEGGFGAVYKGNIPSGEDIAVKRLSDTSTQGLQEFKNEVLLISKLQHRNLVRLLGCCIQGQERMLVYEYMPNNSLDLFIFDCSRRSSLKWSTRFQIIVGIARGLLYLHRDSRQRIIHRDLKASNVLLDEQMNPKISDFGTARAFGNEQLSAKTRTVIGTYGYMSPEYVVDGIFSMKSDVFSFGVIVLEILSGKRNRAFHHYDHDLNLLGHAWNLWKEGQAVELMDEMMQGTFPLSEVMRCIQVGLLCVQNHPEDRPTMSSIVLMLDSDTAFLPQPKQPGFYLERSSDYVQNFEDTMNSLGNDLTHTCLDGR